MGGYKGGACLVFSAYFESPEKEAFARDVHPLFTS